jgi:hypothetical protein
MSPQPNNVRIVHGKQYGNSGLYEFTPSKGGSMEAFADLYRRYGVPEYSSTPLSYEVFTWASILASCAEATFPRTQGDFKAVIEAICRIDNFRPVIHREPGYFVIIVFILRDRWAFGRQLWQWYESGGRSYVLSL